MNPQELKELKNKRKITALTCYDYVTAKVLDTLDLDLILVGDSLAMVMLGYEDTKQISLDDMLLFAGAVKRGISSKMLVFDMPLGTYDCQEMAYENFLKVKEKTGIEIIKLEGSPDIVEHLVERGVSVMGHTGLKPQTAEKFRVVGHDDVLIEAKALEEAGAFSVVLECVPAELAGQITKELSVPTIGIGAGQNCDGQILVLHDMLGLYDRLKPKFLRKYSNLKEELSRAVNAYIEDVKSGSFPNKEESY